MKSGTSVDREPEGPDADVLPPHGQDDEVGLGVPGESQRAVVAPTIEEDRAVRHLPMMLRAAKSVTGS